jgi:outer membrane protein assembly factor BamB
MPSGTSPTASCGMAKLFIDVTLLRHVGSSDQNAYALGASTGALLWSYKTGVYVNSARAVVNGVVYVGSSDGNVCAFGLK